MRTFTTTLVVLLSACATIPNTQSSAPLVDYHQHLVSPAFAQIAQLPARDAKALLQQLDSAGINKAIVLSVGYSSSDERKQLTNPDSLTRAENDWTSAQVALGGGRLVGFCSSNPLRPAALAELERCLALPGMKGFKLHFGNSGVSLRNPAHVSRMIEVFTMAERRGIPILVHMRARGGTNFGGEDARVFLQSLLPAAPSIEVVIAHFGGAGPGYPDQADEVMAVFGAAAARKDQGMRNVYFDVATVVTAVATAKDGELIASRIRQVGVNRVLYGSDLSPPGGSIQSGWEVFRDRTPLTAAEFRQIAGNVTRFAR